MEKVIEAIKNHPLPVIGGVVILLLLIAKSGSGSGGASSAISASLQSQQIATTGNSQIAAINAQAATARGAQGVDAYKTQLTVAGQMAIARTSLMDSLFKTSTEATTTMQVDNNKNQTTRLLGTMNHQDMQTNMANQLALGQSTIDAGVRVATARLDTDIRLNNDNNNARLNALGQTLSSTNANLPAMLQHSENMARIDTSNAQAIAAITAQTAQIISANQTHGQNVMADANARATNAKTSQSWVNLAGSLIGGFF